MEQTRYPCIQHNGQRIYQVSSSITRPPPRGSEIFVGNLPRDIFEDELISLFAEVGPIFKLRLMMDFSGETRGFCFVHYFTVEDANKAIAHFNKQLIQSKSRNARMSVHVSLDNCRLFFGNIPKDKTTEQLKEELMQIIDGVVKVILYAEKRQPNLNRGFAFVEFESHATAAIARRKLLAGVTNLWGNHQKVHVDWAEPEPIVDPMVLTQVKILYFKNVPVSWSVDRFKQVIMMFIRGIQVLRIYKKDNYAFVHFDNRGEAERALCLLETAFLSMTYFGKTIEVEWARPSNYSKKFRGNQLPDNFCTSVPPRQRKLVQKAKRRNQDLLQSSNIASSSSSGSDLFIETDITATENFLANQLSRLYPFINYDF